MAQTKEVAKTEGTHLSNATPEQLEALEAAILHGKPLPFDNDPEAMAQAIAERLASPDASFADVFGKQDLPSWAEDYMGEAVKIVDVRFNPSTKRDPKKPDAPSVYAVATIAVLETGDVTLVQCGGKNVMVQLLQIIRNGWTDHVFRMTSKPAASGNDVLWLEAVQ